jgi:RimJ/RimL family protein N-acetyltransferase
MGTDALAARIARRLRTSSFKTSVSNWYVRRLHAPLSAVPELPAGLRFDVLTGERRGRLDEWCLRNRDAYPWIFQPEELLSSGQFDHWYFCLFREDEIVGYIKVGREEVYLYDFLTDLALPPGVALVYDTFIDPQMRGRGLARNMIESTCRWISRNGVHALFCHIEDWNMPSIKAFSNAEFVLTGRVRFQRLVFLRYWTISGHVASARGLYRWMADQA